MNENIDKKQKLLKQLLTGRLTLTKTRDISEWETVEKEMMRQWKQSADEPMEPIIKHQIWVKIQRKLKRDALSQPKKLLQMWHLIAASIAILLTVGSYWLVSKQTNKLSTDELVQINASQNQLYILPDSSRVWMEKGSSLKYASSFSQNRKVWLTGNSLFEVRKHTNKTFQVQIHKAFIEVKGTAFLVKQSDPRKNEIALFNGEIELNVQATGEKLIVKPSQKVIYDSTNGDTKLQDIENINWKNGKFHFTDIGLSKLIEAINQLYETNIIIGNEVNTNTAFTGSIRYDESLEDVIEKICFSLNLSQEKKDGIIKIHN